MISYKRIYRASNAELISQKKTRIISIILLAFAGIIYGFDTASRGDSTDPSYLAVFIYFTALVPLFSCCVSVFKDMHDIPSADVSMSMPLSGIERYFSKILTVVRAWLVPFLISAAGAFLLSAIFGGSHNSYKYHYIYGNQRLYSMSYHPEVMMKYNLQMFLWFMAAVLFMISVTAVCQCCIGAKAESRYLPVMLMTALSIFVPAVYAFITDHFADVSISDYFSDFSSLFYVWTFSAVFAKFDSLKNVLLMILNCLISAGVIIGGAFICRKRDARTVGKPIVFKAFFEIIMAVTLTLFFILVHVSSGNLVVLFLGWLGSIILRIVVSRKNFSFSKIGVWTGMFAVYYVLFLVFMYIAFLTGGFGAIYKTPSADEYINGVNAYISVNFDKMNHKDYFSDYCSAGFDKSLANGGRDEVKGFVESVSKTAAKQNRLPGVYSYEMFGGNVNYYKCTVRVNLTSIENNFISQIYRINFYVTDSGMHDIIELTKTLGGNFSAD